VRSHCHWFYMLFIFSAFRSFFLFFIFILIFVFFNVHEILIIIWAFWLILRKISLKILVLDERSLFLKILMILIIEGLTCYFLIYLKIILFILVIIFSILILLKLETLFISKVWLLLKKLSFEILMLILCKMKNILVFILFNFRKIFAINESLLLLFILSLIWFIKLLILIVAFTLKLDKLLHFNKFGIFLEKHEDYKCFKF
jgi:hypothetical protein